MERLNRHTLVSFPSHTAIAPFAHAAESPALAPVPVSLAGTASAEAYAAYASNHRGDAVIIASHDSMTTTGLGASASEEVGVTATRPPTRARAGAPPSGVNYVSFHS